MNIRLLNNIEKQYIKELYMQSFDDSEAFVDYYISEFSKDTDTYACIENSEIIAMANVHYKKVMIKSELYDGAYIYGVATLSQYKHQGIMKKILNKVIRELENSGIFFVYLIPAVSPTYYESLGFKQIRGTRIYNIYDGVLSQPEYKLEKNYTSVLEMKKHIKELLAGLGGGYISYKVFPIMLLSNEYTRDLFENIKICGDLEQNIDVNDINELEDIYGDFLSNEDV